VKHLRISTSLSLPLDAVTQTFGVLAKRRAGKSYFLRRLVEQLFKAGQPVVLFDPKGDHWGIRSAADGKSPGLPVLIIGGEHGDIPIEPGAGEIIAKLVVEERVSALIDLSPLRKHEVTTFATGFLENVYRLKARERYRTPMMLAIDEADAIAPQRPMKGEERMLGAAEDIVRRGGQRGIGCAMATQRAAVLNKNVLTQIQILVSLRTIAPQDLDALNAWIDVHGTEEQRAKLMESLPSLPTGDAWFWSPGWPTEKGLFELATVLPIETFDSGATPKPGEKRVEPKRLADIDLEAVKKQMASTLERAKENDPKAIRKKYEARITELERALKAMPKPVADAKRVEVPVLKAEHLKRIEKAVSKIEQAVVAGVTVHNEMLNHVNRALGMWGEVKEISMALTGALHTVQHGTSWLPTGVRSKPPLAISKPVTPTTPSRVAARPVSASDNGDLGKGERAILTVLAQFHGGKNKRSLGTLSGYSASGGSFGTYISRLRTKGYIDGIDPLRITDAGLQALGDFEPLPRGQALVDYWMQRLGKGEAAILRQLIERYPNAVDRDELGRLSGYEASGGSFGTYLSRLRTKELVDERELRASDAFFE